MAAVAGTVDKLINEQNTEECVNMAENNETVNQEAVVIEEKYLFTYYIQDFGYANLTFGEMKFYYEEDEQAFVLASDPVMSYPVDVVREDPGFILFTEYYDEEEDFWVIESVDKEQLDEWVK